MHFLSQFAIDETTKTFEQKLKDFFDSVLVNDELAEKVRAAFDAYIFLSYRKKDRKYVVELLELIHKNVLLEIKQFGTMNIYCRARESTQIGERFEGNAFRKC